MPRFAFFSSLPTVVLELLDETISAEVTPHIKTMGVLPERIQNAATVAAENESTETYLGNLIDAWDRHNKLASEIDQFLVEIYSGKLSFHHASAIHQAHTLLSRAFQTEDRKRIYSVGVKLALEAGISRSARRYDLDEQTRLLLLSSWVPDFWTYRLHTHAVYALDRMRKRDSEEVSTMLADTFHAGESILFEKRLPYILGRNSTTEDALEETIARCVQSESKIRTFGLAGFYLTIGRLDLKAIQRLVQYDNREEYLFSSNMFGMPDFFLRKEIERVLVSTGLIAQRPSIVFYSLEELDHGLQQLQEAHNGSQPDENGQTREATAILPDYGYHLWRGMRNDGARGFAGHRAH